MKVIVYVEGPSDKLAMSNLLESLIEQKRLAGIEISFVEAPSGDKKKSVLIQVPKRALNILRNDPNAIVVALPDLYPKNKGFPHSTAEELIDGIHTVFSKEIDGKRIKNKKDLSSRFHAFCFKHDLEALLLASPEAIADYLKIDNLNVNWTIPVENQNNDSPPKRIVESIFSTCHKRYRETVDAPLILSKVKYKELETLCPQQFKPFVDFLESL